MFQAGILMYIVLTVVRSTTVDPPKELKYYCDINGTIYLKSDGLNTNYSSIYARGTVSAGNGSVSVKDCSVQTGTSPVWFEIKGCKKDDPITVIIMKIPNQIQTPLQSGSVQTPKPFLIGGEGMSAYILTCFEGKNIEHVDQKFPEYYEITQVAQIPIKSTIATTKAVEYYAIVQMLILTETDSSLDNQMIQLGNPLHVVISGPAGPTYFVKECQAYESPNDPSKSSVELVHDGVSSNSMLMTNFTLYSHSQSSGSAMDCSSSAKTCKVSTLYAFHFKDSNQVTLQCTIEVCRDSNAAQCQAKPSNGVHTRRKKRDDGLQRHVLRSTITVYDHVIDTNFKTASHGKMLKSSLFVTVMIAAHSIIGSYD